jgi:membrane associated rhomboid family serine protease
VPRTVTAWIAALIAACWLLAFVLGLSQEAAISMGFIADRLSGAVLVGPAVPAILTPLSATLVHAGLFHLGFNLLLLVWCGTAVERGLGARALIIIYVVSAYVAAMAQWAVDPNSQIPMVGASGAVSGIIGAYALSFGRHKQIVASPRINRALNVMWLLAAWVVLQLMIGLLAGMQGILLATAAHVGGFLAGVALQRPLLLWRFRNA